MSGQANRKLPKGWALAPLGDVAGEPVDQDGPRTAARFVYVDIGSVDNATKRIAKRNEVDRIGAPSRARKNVLEGDVLVSMTRPNLNAVARVGADFSGAVASTGFQVLRSALIEHRWIYYAVQTRDFIKAMSLLVQGALYPAVRPKDIKSWMCPIPPRKEQVRIAETLDELLSDLDAGVASLERIRAKLKRFRSAVLKAAVEGALTAEWRKKHPATEPASALLERILAERRRRWEEAQLEKFNAAGRMPPGNWKTKYPEPVAPDPKKLPPLPSGWVWATVELAGEVRLGRQRAPQHHSGEHMRPYLRVANVYEARLDLHDVKEMNFTPTEFKIYALKYGDILLNEGQSPELVGRPAMYRDEIPGCCYQKTLIRFRSAAGVLPAWALTVFRSYLHSGRFRRSASITTSIAHLAAERFLTIEFPVPPQEEQEAIVEAVEAQLSVIDHLEADLEAKLTSAKALRQSILRDAFQGKLVPQDPNDEPASVLLERIAAQREERARQAKVAKQTGLKPPRAQPARKSSRRG